MESRDRFGTTPLSHAARRGHVEAAALLLKAEANFRSRDETGWTALRWASDAGHRDMAGPLHGCGAEQESDVEEEQDRIAETVLQQPEI
ncbi:hypothetical protein B0H67DRAFT_583057 [Lasiosphaeris hirsuta]|uniref:Ankyrin repeat protein n=1 Tax=Lasiosphaeris hirsuta TaxID=260670 RepID=A0AA40DRC4_9PEZI|nr:hypothetical protein B0H67DRAFT_583057 [Lasiosphaeris hirsuta]